MTDVRNCIVGIGNTVNDGFKQIIDTITEACYTTGVGVGAIITDGGFKVGNVISKLKLLAVILLLKLKALVVLIGGGVWFLITLIPKFLLTILELAVIGAIHLRDSLVRITIFLIRKAVDAVIFIWNYFVDVPLNCILGLLVLYIAYRKRSRLRSFIIRAFRFSIAIYNTYSQIFQLRRLRRTAQVPDDQDATAPPLFADNPSTPFSASSSGPSPRKPIKRKSSISNGGSGSPTSQTCVVCLERKKTVVVMPCKHLCMCQICSDQLQRYQTHCPMCRKTIAELISVYV